MQTVHVDFLALERDQIYAAIHRHQPSRRVLLFVPLFEVVVLAPLLGWYGWHRQWFALAALAAWGLFFLGRVLRSPRRDFERSLNSYTPDDYTLLPEGLEVWNGGNYYFRVWALLKTPLVDAEGITFMYADTALYLFLPRASFQDDAHYQAFAAQASAYHAAANAEAAKTFPRLRHPPADPRYVLHYSLSTAEQLGIGTALRKLREQFPHTFPPKEPESTWQDYLLAVSVLGTMALMLIDLPGGAARMSRYTPSTFGILVLYGGYLWLLLRAYLWLQPRWSRLAPPPIAEQTVTLGEQGLHSVQPGEEYARRWQNYDAVVHHDEKITLWDRLVCHRIIPDRAFATAGEAQACVDWILPRIAQNPAALAGVEVADQPIPFPPDTDNPYQAPRY